MLCVRAAVVGDGRFPTVRLRLPVEALPSPLPAPAARRSYPVTGLQAGLVVRELRYCPAQRRAVCVHQAGRLRLRLTTPGAAPLDLAWSRRVQLLLWERRELDHMMSWLSTLGGAFSALGDYFAECAEMAGRISVKQLELALRLGDPLTEARCKLYAALSLMQRGRFEWAAALVRQQYRLPAARTDPRLRTMCRGVWNKLQYERQRAGAAR
ncbi:uncharacterized protein FJT64_010928 [Amphibalanus amphitrite]|uniref:Uncharacterized protein n=2 Tax=Amphibalanus amphitrite TaxID=1232801 RepID=A0A6A4V8I2_AMPAM|nr:uncharacterized protein F58A4.6-like isoform X2 [Amphibalanus amphitrite]XP_043237430.1 uncharacterized protein F58A4.6-like isoform X2 [Amphibalanus amphitrite]KAF0290896.1 uncharacterized protein FJT64_010928 [Amphibalanus amphitrite]